MKSCSYCASAEKLTKERIWPKTGLAYDIQYVAEDVIKNIFQLCSVIQGRQDSQDSLGIY